MDKSNFRHFIFLLLTLVLSIPFYILGTVFPVKGLPFGLTINFLMIFIPFLLSLIYAWKENGAKGIVFLFKSILDIKRAGRWSVLFCVLCMPITALLAFFTMEIFSFPLPADAGIPYKVIPLMLVLYFLGAIPEEFGWTATLTGPFTVKYGPVRTGILIGGVWALWHIIPWSQAHPAWWVAGMCLLNLLMRTAMVYAYMYGGKSLFSGLVFHTMINVSMSSFPVYGSYMNTWIFSLWMAVLLFLEVLFIKRTGKNFKN